MARKATKLNGEIRVAVSRAFPGVVTLWPAPVLTAWVLDASGIEHPIRAGKPGQGDLTGIAIFSGHGVRLEIETKTPRDSQRVTQKAFQDMIERFSGIYIIGRDVETVVRRLEEELGVMRKA